MYIQDGVTKELYLTIAEGGIEGEQESDLYGYCLEYQTCVNSTWPIDTNLEIGQD